MSFRDNPFYYGETTLDFGDGSGLIPPDDEAGFFLSRYQEHVDPLVSYEDYFSNSAKSESHIFREIKRFYVKLVLNGNWSERKFVKVLDRIFVSNLYLGATTIDSVGRKYDRQQVSGLRKKR